MKYNDLILLDACFNTIGLIEDFTSLRWTRRYFGCGDFMLVTSLNNFQEVCNGIPYNEHSLKARYIYNPESGDTAVIEEYKAQTDASGARKLTLSGRMLEALLDTRVLDSATLLSGYAEQSARVLVQKFALTGARQIGKLALGKAAGYTESATAQYAGITLMNALYNLLGPVGLSPKLSYDFNGDKLYFTVTRGLDRTQAQNVNSWALFSAEFENVRSSSYMHSDRHYRNYIYIGGEYNADGSRRIATLDLTGGGERRELFVDAKGIRRVYTDERGILRTATDAEYNAMLIGKGRQAASSAFIKSDSVEGVVLADAPPGYRVGYDLGDICDYVDGALGVVSSMRITEVCESHEGGAPSVRLTLGNV